MKPPPTEVEIDISDAVDTWLTATTTELHRWQRQFLQDTIIELLGFTRQADHDALLDLEGVVDTLSDVVTDLQVSVEAAECATGPHVHERSATPAPHGNGVG